MNSIQKKLTLLGLTISGDEQGNGHLGPSTRAAIRQFQGEHGLPVTGRANKTTVRAIDAAVADNGVIDPTPTGTDIPSQNPPTGHLPPSNPPTGDLPPSNPPTEDLVFSVEGEVVKPDGTPLRRHLVRAYDRALCDWRVLGSLETAARTDDLGRYRIPYYPEQLKRWGKTRADLKVEIHDPSGDVKLAESPLILQAPPDEIVNFAIGKDRYRGPDEHSRVETALAPLLRGHADLGCLQVADVLILAREAGLASSNVAYFVKASRWSVKFDAPAAMFYGLMRRGEPTRIDALLARPLKRLWNKLEEARKRNYISLALDDALRARLAALQKGYLSQHDHPYAQLLGTTSLSGGKRAVFTQKLTAGNLTGDDLWQELASDDDFSARNIADLQAAFELQSLTGENTSLTVRLRGDLAVGDPREVATFSVKRWRVEVLDDAVEIPDEVYPGGTRAQRRAAYAQMLYRTAELRYPTRSLAGQLSRDPLPGQDSLQAFFTAHPDFEFRDQRVLNFLRGRPRALEGLPETARDELLRIEQLFHLVPTDDKLATIKPMWTTGLRSAPQIAHLGRTNLMRRLGAAVDVKTAHGIYRKAVHVTSQALNVYLRYHPQLNSLSLTALQMPQAPTNEELARAAVAMPEWAELFGSPDACEVSHCESAISPAAYLLDTLVYLEKAVDASGNNALDELLERRPDLGTLRLTCENTETLVPQIDAVNEILEAIVTSADGTTLSGLAIGETTWDSDLLAAQPEHLKVAAYDIVRTSPYPLEHAPFDLWAEEGRRYLEQMGIARDDLMAVMPPKPGVTTREIATEALGMSSVERELICQPTTRPEQLAPSWGIDLAQGTLRAQLKSVEALLDQAHIDYDTLLRLLYTRFVNPGRVISVSFAGMPCSLDGAVLIGAGGAPLTDKPFRELLDRLHRFLRLQRRLACTEYELDSLIHALDVVDFDAPPFVPKIAAAQALRDTLGLSLPELGSWWKDLETYAFEDELPSHYEAVFLDAALFPDLHTGIGPDLRNEVFALRADRADLAITTSTDPSLSPWLAESDGADVPAYTLQPDYASYVQSATRLTAEDVLLLAGKVLPKDAITGHVALTLANLSVLYRVASLARALDVSVTDALRLVAVIGVAPLRTASASAGPIDSLRFHEGFAEIDAGTRSIEELAYLLRHESSAAVALAPSTADIDTWLASNSLSFVGILATDDLRITPELKAALTQSLGTTLAVDPAVLDAVVFTHRVRLGDELLQHVIVAANPGASGLPTPRRDIATVFGTLHKFGLAWSGLALDPTFLPFVLEQSPGLGWIDIADLPMTARAAAPFDAWSRLVAAADLQASTFTLEQSLFALMEDAAAATLEQADDPTSFVLGDFLTQISDWTGWPIVDVTYLTGPNGFDLDLPAALRDEQALIDMQRVFDLIRSRGVAAEQAHAWTIAELTFADAQSIKQVLSLAYPPVRWLEVLGSIQDELRTLKRDALLGHLLPTLGMEDSDAFYRHYLIDPAQSPVDRTSRIVLAHSAVQVFAQRILLNLENFAFERADAEAWQWRKKYRVWEAARKVFLTPENFLEPELRDNKSAFFKELEDGLLQDEVTHENAARLYLQYLHKVDEVGRLEIMGMYENVDALPDTTTLHVFGRTKGIPHLYFHRRWEDEARWTPWERVDLDIDADHLIPAVYNGRLYLFWPSFNVTEPDQGRVVGDVAALEAQIAALEGVIDGLADEKQAIEADPALGIVLFWTEAGVEDALNHPKIENFGDPAYIRDQLWDWQRLDNDLEVLRGELDDLEALLLDAELLVVPRYEIELGMNWSEHIDGRWSPKRISKDNVAYKTDLAAIKHYFTGFVTTNNELRLAVHTISSETRSIEAGGPIKTLVGHFYWDESGSELLYSAGAPGAPAGNVSLTSAYKNYHYWDVAWFTSVVLQIAYAGEPTEERVILETVPTGDINLHYAHQFGPGGKAISPFFLVDSRRTYFVQPPPKVVTASDDASVDARAAAPSARSRRAVPSGSVNGAHPALAATHYQGTDADQVVIHGGGLSSSMNSGSLTAAARILDLDPDPQDTPIDRPDIDLPSHALHRYRFTRFYHPYTSDFLRQFSRHGIEGLLDPDPAVDDDSKNLYRQLTPLNDFDFEATYAPNASWVENNFDSELLAEQIDFDHWSPLGPYNWELFVHIPLLVATRLMQNQRYADARRWLHYIFDPTTASDGAGAERFWKVKPFYEEQLNGPLASLQTLLTEGNASYEQQVQEWERDPFRPDVIARLRISAYMQSVVMRYLTCLIDEADMLFRRDTREDIDEARLLYLLASEILGDRPNLLPAQEIVISTPNLLLERVTLDWGGPLGHHPLDLLASYLSAGRPGASSSRPSSRLISGGVPVDTSIQDFGGLEIPTVTIGVPAQGGASSVDTLLLFAIPHNEMLYEFWDRVADRLFKIRHSMNLSGVVRQLALFAPPIDPALLVRAIAAGLSVEAILSGLFAPRSIYRFSFILQKAIELCGEARGFGGAILAALQNQDGEQLSLLRSTHEVGLLESIRALKSKSVEEAGVSLASLLKSRESAELRATYYASRERISAGELQSQTKQEESRHRQRDAEIAETLASILHVIPSFPNAAFGGPNLGSAGQAVAAAFRGRSAYFAHEANKSGTMAGYDRRLDDWVLQADLAKKEIEQLDKQIIAAEIREQIAQADLTNHEQQIAQAQEVEDFLKLKFTNQQLYSFMVSKLASVHFQAYQMAYQLALQAQSAFYQELGPDEQDIPEFIKSDNWDSLRKGLVAGDLLQLQLRQMETAHMAANTRELEITKHVSLFQLDPAALLELRATGSCVFHLPEALFAMDFAGHFYRRIKAVQITMPCIVGPYANVSATLSLTGSWTRRNTDLSDANQPAQDLVTAPQTAIATSSCNRDDGTFELNFNDPRYRPFEGAGAISNWSLELPSAIRPFDYGTISDVVMHVSYTARDSGDDTFRGSVNDSLVSALNGPPVPLLGTPDQQPRRLFSLRKDFPDAWNQLVTTTGEPERTCTLQLSKAFFPAFLDYEWQTADDETITPQPITLNVTGLTGYLSPQGDAQDASSIVLNERPATGVDLGMPTFDLTGALSSTSIDNGDGVTCTLTMNEILRAEDWNDLYLLMDFAVST